MLKKKDEGNKFNKKKWRINIIALYIKFKRSKMFYWSNLGKNWFPYKNAICFMGNVFSFRMYVCVYMSFRYTNSFFFIDVGCLFPFCLFFLIFSFFLFFPSSGYLQVTFKYDNCNKMSSRITLK